MTTCLWKATHHPFSRDLFRQMKRTAILINVTRGAIVFGEDLMKAIDEGLIWGAASTSPIRSPCR